MRFNSPSQLACSMRMEANRMGGSTSASISNLREALGNMPGYTWTSPETEVRSITKFAQEFGFEYLSQTTRNGQRVCNFWLVAPKEAAAVSYVN